MRINCFRKERETGVPDPETLEIAVEQVKANGYILIV